MRGLGSSHVTCWPMRGLEINFIGRRQTDRQTDRQTRTQTDGHGASMTDPAQSAESVKIKQTEKPISHNLIYYTKPGQGKV